MIIIIIIIIITIILFNNKVPTPVFGITEYLVTNMGVENHWYQLYMYVYDHFVKICGWTAVKKCALRHAEVAQIKLQ